MFSLLTWRVDAESNSMIPPNDTMVSLAEESSSNQHHRIVRGNSTTSGTSDQQESNVNHRTSIPGSPIDRTSEKPTKKGSSIRTFSSL